MNNCVDYNTFWPHHEPRVNKQLTVPTMMVLCTIVLALIANSAIGSPGAQAAMRIRNSQRVSTHLIDDKISGGSKSTNISVEDRMWKVAAVCLRTHFGQQFLANKDIKCAAAQVVLTLSRMQRAACKSCEPYFHCRAFSNVQLRCKDNHDVQKTIEVIRTCRPLYTIGDDEENSRAIDDALHGLECSRIYLCRANCRYNPIDATCPRNNCPLLTSPRNSNLTITTAAAVASLASSSSFNDQLPINGDGTKSMLNQSSLTSAWRQDKMGINSGSTSPWVNLSTKAFPADSPHKHRTVASSPVSDQLH